jgi:uncharacterized repeat protein (TIGR02543 family)
MKSITATKTAFFLLAIVAIFTACLILCSRDNPYDVNSDVYIAGSKPKATFLDSVIIGYLYDTVGIKIICSDTAKGGSRGAIKTFYFDWNGSGAFTDSAAGTAEDTITIRKAFNARNVTAHMRAMDLDGNFSTTDSIKLTILPSNPQIVDVVAPATVPKSVSFTIAVSATDNGGVINAFLWAVNGVNYTQVTLTGSITLSFDQVGDKTIKVKARDDKTIESPERSIFIRVINPLDTIGPHITFLSPLDHDTLRTPDILVTLQVVDENSVNTVTVNGASFQQVGNIWRGAMTLNEGVNAFIATAADANNNVSMDSITVYFAKSLIDTVPPLVVMIVPPKKQDTVYTAQLYFRLRALDESGVAGVWLNDEVMIRDSLEDGCYVAQKALNQGINNFVIKAADGLGNTGYDSVTVYRDTQANDTMPPTLSITSPRLYAHFIDSSITVKGLVIDASGIFSLQVNGIEAIMNYPNWQAVVPLRYGYDTITVVAFDASAKSNKAVQSVIVIKNSAPQFTVVPVDTNLWVPTVYSISASAIDPENGPLTFSLLPTLFTSATAPTLTPSGQNIAIAYTPNASGIDTFKLVVTDALKDADTAVWRVFLHLPNDSSPVFTTDVKSLPNTIIAPNTLQTTVTAIDPNNQPLTYSLIRPTTPTGMTINATTGSITWATTIADTGAKHIIVQASNGRQSDTLEWNLTVLFHNTAPVLANPGIQTVNEGQTLSLTLIATDPNNDPLTFLFGPQFPSTATLDSNHFSWTPGYSDSGRRTVTIIARERTRVPALSDTETFIIIVTNVNPQTPALVSPLNGATAQPISFALIWKKTAAAETYHLQLSTDTVFKTITIQDSVITDTLKTVIGLANNTTYYWHVKAKNPGGESAWSTRQNFTTIVATPGVPSLIYPAHNASNVELNLMLQWSAITGANSYTVQVDDQSNFTSPVLNVAANGTSQAVTLSNGTKYYWRVNANISGIAGAWATDSFFTIFSAPVITVQPANQTVNEGSSASFSVTATGSQLTYQWQSRTNGSAAWSNIFFATSATYLITTAALTNSGSQFRCVVSNSGGAITSNAATLTVSMVPPTISVHPSNQNVTEGASASFSVTAAGSQLTYQWQRSNNNGATWTNVGFATSSTYTISSTILPDNNARFRCVIANTAGSVTSNTATLTVTMAPPTIAIQPWDQGVTVGASATFSVTANGSGTLTYQWLRNGIAIQGATSATYTTPATTINDNNTQFRCVVTNAGGSVTSNTVTLWVNAAPTYLVIYNANGGAGQVTDPNRYTAGATVTVLGQGNLTRNGYTFTNWNTAANGTGTNYAAGNTFLMPAGNDTLFAQWTVTAIAAPTLVFPANNQTGVSISPTCTWSSVTNAATYHVQWSTINNNFTTGAMNDSTLTTNYKGLTGLTNATTYYWRARAKNIVNTWSSWSTTWSFTTITATPGIPSLEYPSNKAVNVETNPVLRWQQVTGSTAYNVQVATNANFSPNSGYSPSDTFQALSGLIKNTKYYWRVNAVVSGNPGNWATDSFTTISTYTLTMSAGTGGTVSPSGDTTVDYGVATSISATPATGYAFVNWMVTSGTATIVNPSSASTTVTLTSENATVTATFAIKTYTLTTSATNGSITKNPDATSYDSNTVVSLTATPATGFEFTGWSGDASGTTNSLSVIMDGDKNITADFIAINYTVTFVAGTGGSITGTLSQIVPYGSSCSAVTAVPTGVNTFNGWTGDYTGTTNPLTITNVTADMTITANFTTNYTVTFVAGTGGSITGTTTQIVASGSDCLEVIAVPDGVNTFSGWTGDYTGTTNPLTITNVTADMTITANFAVITEGP